MGSKLSMSTSAGEESVKEFIAASVKENEVVFKNKDVAGFDQMWDKFWAEGGFMIRPSGNPLTKEIWRDMVTAKDIKMESTVLKSVDSINLIAGGQAAVVTYTAHDKFTYKGTANDDIAKFSGVLEKQGDGAWKFVHLHRATGQKPE